MRNDYIDNLRWMTVLLLFPYHILMIFNSFGENFYIRGESVSASSGFLFAIWPWFMPLLFVIAGISAAYALQRRQIGAYVRERVVKLLIPLVAGLLLVIPAQTYFAERFHNGYTGSYFAQYRLFFTKITDLTGYNGGFTPGQLWFLAYLFVISLVAIPLIVLGRKLHWDWKRISWPALIALFVFPLVGTLILDIAGKSLGEYFAYFILGYFLLSKDQIQEKLERGRFYLFTAGLSCMAVWLFSSYGVLPLPELAVDIFSRGYAWVMILALLGMGKKYLSFNNRFTSHLSQSSFSVYLFHQTWIVTAAYYVFAWTSNAWLRMAWIFLLSVPLTFATYELFRRIPGIRFLFAIKKPRAKKDRQLKS